MRRGLKIGMAWLLLLVMLAEGCAALVGSEAHERAPSPTSALTEGQAVAVTGSSAPAEDIRLQFTEVRSSGDREGAYAGCESEDWFELYNAGTEPVALGRLFITNDPENPDQHPLPDVSLAPGQYVAVCCCGKEGHPSVPMGIARRGEGLWIFDGDKRPVCELSVPPLEADISWAFSDGTWGYCAEPTPGQPNGRIYASLDPMQVMSLDMEVSELLMDGKYTAVTPDGAYCDFVELHNPTDHAVSLRNWYLSDGVEDLTKWAFPDVEVPSGGYLLVLLGGDGQPRADGLLQADFSVSKGESVVLYDGRTLSYRVFTLPERIRSDVSVGPDGEYYLGPTPGRENGPASYTAGEKGCYDHNGVFISEVCGYAGADENDWIELYNATGETVSLGGWQIRKDRAGEKAMALSGAIAAGGYAVFETTAQPSRQKEGVGAFGISGSGQTLYLLDDAGALRDEFATGVLMPNVSSGRVEGNGEIARVFFRQTTKGGRNSDTYALGYAKAPMFSETGLYQTEAFKLTLTSGDGANIYYTTNGSEPTSASKQYSGPLSIKSNMVIRALAVQEGMLDSEIVTYTFLFEEPHTLPVVCLSFDPEDREALWSGRRKDASSKKQRKGYFSYYEGGELATQFPADFKSKGASTLGYSQAALSIHLRGRYGQGSVTYPFFKEYGWQEYSSLCIRHSGQDGSQARVRDSYANRLCLGLNVDAVATRPVIGYINGEYYGIYDLNEDQNDDFLNTHYGVDKDDVEIIRFNYYIIKGSDVDWLRVIDYAKTQDLADDAVYEKFTEWVDPDYFIDYLVCSMYLCNRDMANQKYWHTRDNAIRWRPILYDFDYAMGFKEGSPKQSIIAAFFNKRGTPTATSRIFTYIAVALVKNAGWRQRFIERYVELTLTAFAPERAIPILNELRAEMEPEMRRHIARWRRPYTYKKWSEEMDYIEKWMQQRPEYALKQLATYFELSQSYMDELVAKYAPTA